MGWHRVWMDLSDWQCIQLNHTVVIELQLEMSRAAGGSMRRSRFVISVREDVACTKGMGSTRSIIHIDVQLAYHRYFSHEVLCFSVYEPDIKLLSICSVILLTQWRYQCILLDESNVIFKEISYQCLATWSTCKVQNGNDMGDCWTAHLYPPRL